MAKQGLLATIRERYRASSRKDKSRILDEFIAVTGHYRKHRIRLLSQCEDLSGKTGIVKGPRIYDEAVREAVILTWEAFESRVASPGGVQTDRLAHPLMNDAPLSPTPQIGPFAGRTPHTSYPARPAGWRPAHGTVMETA